MSVAIRDIAFDPELMSPLLREGTEGDGGFLSRLESEWRDGRCRFEGSGEFLLGAFEDERLCGVGGLSSDPFHPAPGLGRVRHVYVLKACRGRGIGRALVGRIIERARFRLTVLRLRTRSREAARLYESFGFVHTDAAGETHRLEF